ncbi:uncharacterized protein (TIGR00288 family) [Sphingomonas jejuensis]|uniref:Uncharacterized protein (TIGR00288 family) n=2 Tax=Sphingomonas jejuensis TaxID=904715 RepID=A0ABX0XL13_9SPHN|nr:uncharacterized protein (TIGR00288 family) [Sphingomonas jejuensis]
MTGDTRGTARNIALLIDADNASLASLDPVLTVLAELGTVNIRRAYGNWRKQGLAKWADATLSYGIEPQQQFDVTKGKNATDMKMTIDAMDLLARGRVDGFGLMSSDSDFMPLAIRIKQEGLPVYGFGRATTPEGFRQACTRFIDVDAIVPVEEPARPAAAPAASGGTGPDPAPGKAPRTAAAKPSRPDEALERLLIDAYNAVKHDDRGFARLSEVGQRAGNRSSFDARNYGFKRLSDLVDSLPYFTTEAREGGNLYVKRMG